VFQPAKLKLDLAIVPAFARVVFELPFAVVAAGTVLETDVCPLPLYVIVEFHCAYKVTFPLGINVVEATA
jgi:hypothetical protein